MASPDAHIPTQGAARDSIRYFGDDYLRHDDFFGRLPTDIIVRLARRGIDTPDPMLQPYIFNAPFYKVFIPIVKEAFVNRLLNSVPKEKADEVKIKLRAKSPEWIFNTDKPQEVPVQNIYS